jgi:hypothetical protein
MADEKPKTGSTTSKRRTQAARAPRGQPEAAEPREEQPEPESERLERLREVLQRKATFG